MSALEAKFYNYFRDYDPSIGSFTTSDPIGHQGELNTYAYAKLNPNTFIDPKGLTSIVVRRPRIVPPRPMPLPRTRLRPIDQVLMHPETIDEALPKTDDCKTSKRNESAVKCGSPHKVMGCYVAFKWKMRSISI